jgi:hypothetical protein
MANIRQRKKNTVTDPLILSFALYGPYFNALGHSHGLGMVPCLPGVGFARTLITKITGLQ